MRFYTSEEAWSLRPKDERTPDYEGGNSSDGAGIPSPKHSGLLPKLNDFI